MKFDSTIGFPAVDQAGVGGPPSSSGKKVLLISGFRIFPSNTGGHVRTAGIAAALARMGHEVLLYSLAGRQDDYAFRNGLLRSSSRVERIAPGLIEETNLGLGYGLLQAVGRRLNYPRVWQHGLMRRGLIPRRLKQALHVADIVLCDLPWCAPIPGPWQHKPWILVSHNLEYRLLEQGPESHRGVASWMKNIESAAPSNYRDIFTCAEEDRDFFRRHDTAGRLKLPLIRCGVDPKAYATPDGTRQRVRAELGLTDEDTLLVFSGSGFAPNVQALGELRTFCRAESEYLARARIRILVLGSVAPDASRDGALFTTGKVPEVAPYLAAADAGLNPVMFGSGANVKLFEYLAVRLPVLSTKFGVRGTELEPEVDYLLLDPAAPRAALERFMGDRTREQWRAHAEEVWVRHRNSCDIDELVRAAVAEIPEFKT